MRLPTVVLGLTMGGLTFFSISLPTRGDDWPQWRGPNSAGVSTEKRPLPAELSAETQAWSVPLGEGIGSPVVAAGRVFATAVHGERPGDRFSVHCFDVDTGREIWSREFPIPGGPLANIHAANSYASSTPAADAERVYLYFTRLGLFALDARTGSDVWRCELPEPYFVFDWGPGMSPILYEDSVVFCQDDDLFPAIYCVDRATGRVQWRDDRSDMACNYSHPVVCETERGPQLVVAGTGKLIGYNPESGRREWAAALFCRNIKTTPVCVGETVYVSLSSKGISYQWRAVADADGDGRITRTEIETNKYRLNETPIPDAFWAKFERGDSNGDGVLEGEEIDRAFLDPSNQGGVLASEVQERLGGEKDVQNLDEGLVEAQAEASIQAIRAGGQGDVSSTHLLWRHKTKEADHVVSPLVVDGRMLLIRSGGYSACFRTDDGGPIWKRKRIGNSSRHLGSPVYGDGKVYVPGDNGTVVVLESGPELKVLGKHEVGNSMSATPAIADGKILIRTRDRLLCFEK